MKVKLGISNRHIHLNEEDFKLLFGDTILEKRNELYQPGEYASNLTVTLEGDKGLISNVRVIGPIRSYTQVEVSKTDCYTLGIDAPVARSGVLTDAKFITIANGDKKIIRKSLIIACRHIHISPEERKKYNLLKDSYKIKIDGIKKGILDDVYIEENEKNKFELHLDTDDANAFLLQQNDELEIIVD